MRVLILLIVLAAISNCAYSQLQDDKYFALPLGSIKPQGWLRQQLIIMRKGSTGHLDEVHTKIARENGWLGGTGDGWEETPYWLDGAVPLAYLLDDKELKAKVLKYINWTLDHQRASGYFGPITKSERTGNGTSVTPENCGDGEDWWPKMIMLKVLQQYYEATNDRRVIPFMTNYFRYQHAAIKSCPLGKWTEWATSRGADNVMMAQWLHRKTGDKFLLELAAVLDSQAFAWSEWLGNRDWVMWAAANQTDEYWMRRHAVNIGMALKAPVINFQRTGDPKYVRSIKTGWNDLMNLHGLPMGIFSGDEDLHGNDPTQGVELCAIVEAMFSLENIIAVTGDIQYMDALERMTYNALPTQTTDTYNEKQYFQIANQVQISRGVFDFSLPFDRQMNNVLGLRSGYTCCTANMHQGWTKFVSHLFYGTPENGIAVVQYAPSVVSARVGKDNSEITLTESTQYPFSDDVNFELSTNKDVLFPMHFRIPSWCKAATISVNDAVVSTPAGGSMEVLSRTWKNGDRITLRFQMDIVTTRWGKNSRAVERGPLVYALKLNERWEKGTEPREGDYFSVYPTEDWNYGLMQDQVLNPSQMTVAIRKFPEPFLWNVDSAPIEITAKAKKIPSWKANNGVAHQPVTDRDGSYKGEVDPLEYNVTLVPYGFTKVRIVAFPVVK
jgi:uncharacterized protein